MCMFPICSLWLSDSKTVFVFSVALLFPVKVKFYPPLIQKGPPLGWKIRKNVGLLILIAQKKGFDALNATQKTLALCKVPFLEEEKTRKTGKTGNFWQFWPFLTIWAGFSWFFHKQDFAESWGFLRCIQCIKTLLLRYQYQQFDNYSYFSP